MKVLGMGRGVVSFEVGRPQICAHLLRGEFQVSWTVLYFYSLPIFSLLFFSFSLSFFLSPPFFFFANYWGGPGRPCRPACDAHGFIANNVNVISCNEFYRSFCLTQAWNNVCMVFTCLRKLKDVFSYTKSVATITT